MMANLNTPISVVTSESLESILWDIENCGFPYNVQPEDVAGNVIMSTSTSVVRSESPEKRVTLMTDSNLNVLQSPMNQQVRIASDVPVVGNCSFRPENVNVLRTPMNQQNQTASNGTVAMFCDIENSAVPCTVRHEDVNVPQRPMNQENQTASAGPVSIPCDTENCTAPCDVRHEDVNVLQPPMNQQNQTPSDGPVAILWDIENCCVPSDVRPEDVAGNIRMAQRVHPVINGNGAVVMFSAYGDFNAFPVRLREGCQRTGVKLIDVPNGRKDAADKAILVDMFLFALDNPPPSSIVLISGDVDFAPALHILGQRGYTVILVIPTGRVSPALCSAGKFVWDWPSVARGKGFVPPSKVLMPPREVQMVKQVVTEEQKNKKNQKKRCSGVSSFPPSASSKQAMKRQKSGSTARPGQQATSVANNGGYQGANTSLCGYCHNRHTGECRKKTRACFRCGSKDHFLRDCSAPSKGSDCSRQNKSGNKGKTRRGAGATEITPAVMPGEKQDAPDVILAEEQEKGGGSDQGKAKEKEKGEGIF